MKASSQPTLPTMRDWREPQTIEANQLAALLAEAQASGFEAVRMTVLKPSGYMVTFQRMPDEPPCACGLCQALTAPSDQIAAALRHSAAQDAPQAKPDVAQATTGPESTKGTSFPTKPSKGERPSSQSL